jgi:hypothetical protein
MKCSTISKNYNRTITKMQTTTIQISDRVTNYLVKDNDVWIVCCAM